MKKFYLCLLLVLCFFTNARSQTLIDLYPKFLSYGFGDKIYGEKIERINGREDHILKYDPETFDVYKDSIANPELIRYVEIRLDKDLDLQKAFDDLAIFPNLFYLKLDGFRFFQNNTVDVLPADLSAVGNVEFVDFHYGGVDERDLNKLAALPKLRFLAFNGLSQETTQSFDFTGLPNLEGLHFAARYGPSFHPSIGQLSNLKSISLSGDHYPDFAVQFSKLKHLPQLGDVLLSYFDFPEKADTVFQQFTDIEKLELRNVAVKDLGSFTQNLSGNDSLVQLKIFGADAEKYQGGFQLLDQLEYLDLGRLGDSISFIEDIFALRKLRILKISEAMNIGEMGPGIAQLQKLDSLTFINADLEKLPEEIGQLSNLKYLRITRNNLKGIPATIGALKDLQTLIADNNKLSSLPLEIGNLESLEHLSLGENKLVYLPETLGRLPHLKSLGLQQNLLTHLPASISQLNKLETLHLNENDLQALPKEFGGMSNLVTLDLSENFLQELPLSIGHLKHLETLRLENNDLRVLPETFGGLQNLRVLFLRNRKNTNITFYDPESSNFEVDNSRKKRKENSLELLPESFSQLEDLETIWLSGNPLKEKPLFEVLKNLKSEKYTIYLEDCWLNSLPTEGWKSILAKSMDLSDNQIANFPENIKEAPNLGFLNLNRNPLGEVARNYNSREKLLISFNEAGFIEVDDLPKTPSMVEAYLGLAYGKKDNAEKLAFFDKAFAIDSAFTLEKIRTDDFAETLLKAKKYKKSIEFYTRAIQRDTARNVRILNFIVPQFTNRAKGYLAIGDTLSAIKDLEIVSEKFSAGDWGEAALLAQRIGNDSLADYYFDKGIEFYQKGNAWDKEHNQLNPLEQLSLLELYIITEDFEEANVYLSELKKEKITDTNSLKLLDYLELVLEILNNEKGDVETTMIKERMYSTKIERWSFDLFRKWLDQTGVEASKVEQLKILTNLLEWEAG